MDVQILLDTPPWDWPPGTDGTFLRILNDRRADASDRLVAAELAGETVVVNDDLAGALLAIVKERRRA